MIQTPKNKTWNWPVDGEWSSSESGDASMFSSAAEANAAAANTSAPSTASGPSSPSASGPTSNALTTQDLLLIFQEDLRNLQARGVRITMNQQPHGLRLTLHDVRYDPHSKSLMLLPLDLEEPRAHGPR